MTYQEVAGMVEAFGLPCAYLQFEEGAGPGCPFVVFYYPGRNDFIADDVNYAKISELVIELYSDNKDFVSENAVETVLDAYGMTYSKEETYIGSEKMFEVIYTMEVLINARESGQIWT